MHDNTTPEPAGRPAPSQNARELATARHLLALFDAQLDEYDRHHTLGRRARRAEVSSGRYDVTIDARLEQLRAGRATWSARVDALAAEEEQA